jgi:hypothetical protein
MRSVQVEHRLFGAAAHSALRRAPIREQMDDMDRASIEARRLSPFAVANDRL